MADIRYARTATSASPTRRSATWRRRSRCCWSWAWTSRWCGGPTSSSQRLVDAGLRRRPLRQPRHRAVHPLRPGRTPNPWKALLGRVPPAYTARDMLDDALAVMDAVGWSSAHVMGGSMGAGIAQALAMEYPGAGALADQLHGPARGRRAAAHPPLHPARRVPDPGPDQARRPRTTSRSRPSSRSTGPSPRPATPFPRTWARQAARDQPRAHPGTPPPRNASSPPGAPTGTRRWRASPPPRWSSPARPTPSSAGTRGRDTARRIPGARFRCFDGMGHDIPQALVDAAHSQIRNNADRADM